MKIYLASPMNDTLPSDQKWRLRTSILLESMGIQVLHPTRWYTLSGNSRPTFAFTGGAEDAQFIQRRDFLDLERADLVIMNLMVPTFGNSISKGCLVEIGGILAWRKPLVVVASQATLDLYGPMMKAAAWMRTESVEEAVRLACLALVPDLRKAALPTLIATSSHGNCCPTENSQK